MKKTVFTTLTVVLVLCSCQGGSSNNEATTKPVIEKGDSLKKDNPKTESNTVAKTERQSVPAFDIKTFNADNRFNATASVLAGVKTSAGSLKKYLDSSAWKENAAFIDSSWSRLERSRLSKMRTWREKEFAVINQNTKTLFYPFSGPDFLTAFTFFPDVDKYVMIALEPMGKLPEVAKLKHKDAEEYLHQFKISLTDIFNKSYFITKNMNRDLNYQKVNGVLPVLAFFIKRTGNDIADIKYVVRLENDSIVEVPYEYADKKNLPFGVRIDIVSNSKPKTVYYFRQDLSNKKFNNTTPFYKYLANMQSPSTYVKSASYLLHNDFMDNIRLFILDKSNNVIEDDTGIPFKYFTEKGKWDYKLYGEYAKPVSDFKWLDLQKELKTAFEKDSASIAKLPFHLGYHWGSKKDVLIVCSKK
ncbi:MAG TPA: hypothetical protein VNY73_01215 [Bacteroidia bacterium]|nr:hypothetical protein [Bacteroidia bacterium]